MSHVAICTTTPAENYTRQCAPGQTEERLQLKKSIYPKPKRLAFKANDVADILNLEIQTHLRNNGDLAFEKMEGPVKGSGGEQTYTLHFKHKQPKKA